MKRVVIIGGGIAGTTLAESLANANKENIQFEITLIEREMHPLYSRVLLPHYLRGQISRDRVFLKQESWYTSKGIEWMRGIEVRSIDSDHRFVLTSEGREIPYDILIIGAGGDVRLRQEDLQGMCYLRGIDDADALLARAARVHATGNSARAVTLGSSFIAIEFINYLHKVARFEVHALLRGSGFWAGMMNEVLQRAIAEHMIEQGVLLHTDLGDIHFEESGEGLCVRLGGANLEDVGIAGIGIGIAPDFSMLADTDLEYSDVGIHVDEYLQTNIPDVYAIGDIAHYFDRRMNRHVTIGNWQNALMQGRYLAKLLLGERVPFDLVTSYATNILGLEVTFIGDTVPAFADRIEVKIEEESHLQLFYRQDALVGAIIVGPAKIRTTLTKAITTKTQYGTST